MMKNSKLIPHEDVIKQLDEAKINKEVALSRLDGLSKFAFTFSLREHSSINKIKKDVKNNLSKAFSK